MNDTTLFFTVLVVLLLLLIVIGRYIIPFIDSKIPERKAVFVPFEPVIEPNLKTFSLTSNYFLLHLLTLFSIIAILFLIGIFYPSFEFAGIFIMIAYLIGLAKFKSSKKNAKTDFR